MPTRRAVAWLVGAVLALQPLAVLASSLDRFAQFLSTTQSAKGEFEQKVVDQGGRIVQQSRGTLAFKRPGKFRWTYVKPYAQIIVGDGTRVWIYDEDLRQVTVRRVDQALTSTPAALLAGNNEAMRAFRISDEGEKDGLEWLEAVPRDKEGGFERVRMGFGSGGLEAMEFYDSFGQITLLRFTSLARNPGLDPSTFRFSPPKGADIVGE
ncbi:MAG: outer membrane lipoprotein carrier protein LolA [Betaproteobacteria bacterium RBG_16_64_18]|nr:MAG: outer membrane lipoprotein carrier protein LolA [Betaproteobacteria bacterium RBG_16_64_18]OGA40792.1 MAG: outer membrane lipoprotein carrier protein LolA [Betaproteobacteria bacterium RIFCSPLOWO2_12_FULL_65_110]